MTSKAVPVAIHTVKVVDVTRNTVTWITQYKNGGPNMAQIHRAGEKYIYIFFFIKLDKV